MDVRGRVRTRAQRDGNNCHVPSLRRGTGRSSKHAVVTTAVLQTTRPSSPDPRTAYLERLYQQPSLEKWEGRTSGPATINSNLFINDLKDVLTSETEEEAVSTNTANMPPSGSGSTLQFGNVHVFCYGANMSISSLHQRKVLKIVSRDPATVVDPSVHLVFKHRGGQATLAALPPGAQPKYPSFDGKVHGVLYQMSHEEMKKLRQAGYVQTRLLVRTYDGKMTDAVVFVSSVLSTLTAEVAPTESYMRMLRRGASDNYLDPAYQAFLSSIETVTSAGLPVDYYDTPSKYLMLGWALAGLTGVLLFFLHHHW